MAFTRCTTATEIKLSWPLGNVILRYSIKTYQRRIYFFPWQLKNLDSFLQNKYRFQWNVFHMANLKFLERKKKKGNKQNPLPQPRDFAQHTMREGLAHGGVLLACCHPMQEDSIAASPASALCVRHSRAGNHSHDFTSTLLAEYEKGPDPPVVQKYWRRVRVGTCEYYW